MASPIASDMSVPWIGRTRDHAPILRPSDPDFAARDQVSPFKNADDALTHATGVMIYSLFPGHPWEVYADHKQGIVSISIPALMGATHKGIIPIRLLVNEGVLRKCVLKVAGEILERYNLPRSRFSPDEFLRALSDVPLHKRGYHGHIPG